MKLTKENYKEFVPENEQGHIFGLLEALDELNNFSKIKLFINWQDYHDEYSSERTEPCPDFYGYYTFRFEEFPYDVIGVEMTINELDNAICLLYEYNLAQNNKDFLKSGIGI